MRDVFIAELLRQAKRDPDILLLTGDLGFKVFDAFREERPDQFLNVGVAEQNMTGLAAGMALSGKTVFTYSIGNFPTLRCLEQIRNDAGYHHADVKVVCIGGGFSYGALGFSHHATEDLSILRALPGMTVVVPSDLWETEQATRALVELPGTCYLRLDKSHAPPTHREGEVFELGKARTVREGDDITLITAGGILGDVLEAADELSGMGIEARVLSMHTIRPIDEAAICAAARETGGIVTVEENTVFGGLGGAVAEVCVDHGVLPRVFKRMGLQGEFTTIVGSQQYLRAAYGLDKRAIVDTASGLLEGGGAR